MTREEVHVPSVKGFERKADNSWDFYVCDNPKIAYVRLTQFVPDSFEELKKALTPLVNDGMKGLILDLRFNPGGRLGSGARYCEPVHRSRRDCFHQRPKTVLKKSTAPNPTGVLPPFPMIVSGERTQRQRQRNRFGQLDGQQTRAGDRPLVPTARDRCRK